MFRFFTLLLCSLFLFSPDSVLAQGRFENSVDTSLFKSMKYRHIGPFRGGRSAAVTGTLADDKTFYLGSTGGGVWKTTTGGEDWYNVSDGFFGGSIGAVTVAESDPNVIYVGGGEKTIRGNVSSGSGLWKSTDAGDTWSFVGLGDGKHIPRIRIHPTNPELVYAAVLGHLYGPNEQRGVFRSKDGGKTWERILFVNPNAGAIDLVMDPTNHRILYASFWQVKRTPYSLESGGEGSGLWKSTDGGDSWTELTENKGLPKGIWGISGVTVSPQNPKRIWTIIENENGGVFRSDDGGNSWTKTNSERSLRQRAWYYTRIYADPQNVDRVYVLNVQFWRSDDGGRSFRSFATPHGDHHDLWINPKNNTTMIVGDDGGAQVSFNGAESWSTYRNQPTAQFYRVTTDNHFPYRIYSAQQDNSTIRIPHRSTGRGISESDWERTAGGESGWIAPDPEDPEIVYGGSYGGFLQRYDHRTKTSRLINIWPENPMGWAAKDLKFRFQWNFPIAFSRHDAKVLYAAGNHLFKTTNEGQSWEMISPDLTRNDTTRMGASGGPITKDNTSVEYYGTIFALAEGLEPGTIWVGSDDGLIHLSRDHGKSWGNVTPPRKIMPEWMQINAIEAHPTEPGGLYVAGTRYKSDDFAPYLYKTTNYGKTWEKITEGIESDHFTRVVRADPKRAGLLFAGTEEGIYISFNDGKSWQPFQRNLPIVPITDLTIKDDDLIVATQGRSLWIMDDIYRLRHLGKDVLNAKKPVFLPTKAEYRLRGGNGGGETGENHHNGVRFDFWLPKKPDSTDVFTFRVTEADGDTILTWKSNLDKKKAQNLLDQDVLEVEQGMNTLYWDFRYPDAKRFDRIILWGGGLQGPTAVPGTYKAHFEKNGSLVHSTNFEILNDPRFNTPLPELQKQFDLLTNIRTKLTRTHQVIEEIRLIKVQLGDWKKKLSDYEELKTMAESITKELSDIEKRLYQTKNESRQDPLNFPIRLNNKLSALVGVISSGDFQPTDQAYDVYEEVVMLIDLELLKYDYVLETSIPAFNKAVLERRVPAILVD